MIRKFVVLLAVLALLATMLAPAGLAEEGSGFWDSAPPDRASHRLIVELQSPSLAAWAASVAARGAADLMVDGRLNVESSAAQVYVQRLQAEQRAFAAELQRAVPSARVAAFLDESGRANAATYQVVMNGVAIDLGRDADTRAIERSLSRLPNVKRVYRDRAHYPALYASLPLINAPTLWSSAAIGGQANAGKGIKVASVDGGVHHAAAMFNGDGYTYPPGYPKGDTANTNGKIIVSRAYFRPWDPPAAGDENTWPGPDGTSHGVHTASTAAGNPVTANYLGVEAPISGVAPAAYVMSYRVFYASVGGDASFYDVEGVAALEDMVADGADVVNNSWGEGPTSSGGEFAALDSALINATKAGVFVSMAAGNSGPGNGTVDNPSSDYINVAASSTAGTLAAGRLKVTAPEPVPATCRLLVTLPPPSASPSHLVRSLAPMSTCRRQP